MDLITPKVAASILFVHPETLRRYEQEGELSEHKTPGGHRRYSREEIEELKELIAAGGKPSSNKGKHRSRSYFFLYSRKTIYAKHH